MTDIPKIMRAAAIDRFGGPEVLTLHLLPTPVPEAGEVLIALQASGVGSWDADMRGGWWPDGNPPPFPIVLGSDGAGVLAARGEGAERLNVGDRVWSYSFANPKGGFYAEYVAVPEAYAAPVPEILDLDQAGAVPTVGLTALQGIDDALHVRQDQRLIIHGASGGVGTMAVQFAKLRGALVFATASGADGAALARELGADEAVDGRHEDVTAAARRFAPDGADAVFATVGAGLDRCLEALRPGGRLAYPNGIEPEPAPRPGIEVITYDGTSGVEQFERLNQAVTAARLRVVIAAVYPLDEAAEAHRRLAAGHVLGKLALRIHEA